MYFREENKPAAGGNFLEFSSDLHFGNAFSVKGFESSRGPNPQNFPPAAGFSPHRWREKNPEFSVRDLIVSKKFPPAAGGILFSS